MYSIYVLVYASSLNQTLSYMTASGSLVQAMKMFENTLYGIEHYAIYRFNRDFTVDCLEKRP